MTSMLNVLIEVTIYSAMLYGAILLFKKVFHKHISAALNYAVWGLLIFRLLMPVTIDSGFSLIVIPELQTPVIQRTDTDNTVLSEEASNIPSSPQMVLKDTASNDIVNIQANTDNQSRPEQAVNWTMDWQTALVLIWIMGVLGSAAYVAAFWRRLKRQIKKNSIDVPSYINDLIEKCKKDLGLKDEIRVTMHEWLNSPALSASLRPQLLLPANLPSMDRQQVEFGIRHELTHYRRRDHLTTMLLILLRCVYWFNPIVWLSFSQIQTDMETVCDANVTSGLQKNERVSYINTMVELSCKTNVRYVLGMGTCKGRKALEKRVRGVFMKKTTKPSVRMTAILLAGVMLIACFTTACQPTPEESVVVGKNNDNLDSIIESTPAPINTETLQQNETWQEQLSGNDVTINIDAEIVFPQAAQFPVVEVGPKLYTEDDAWKIIKVFFQDSAVYDEPIFTKEVLEAQIVTLKKELSDIQSGAINGDVESTNEQIEYYSKLLQNAPSENDEIQAMSDLTFKENADGNDVINVSANIGDNNYPATLMIWSNDSDYSSGIYFSNRADDISTTPVTENNMKMTLDEAVSSAQSMMSDLGIEDMILAESGIEGSTEDEGYVLNFIKSVNGIGMPDYQSHMMTEPEEGETVYAPFLQPEAVNIYINDSGVLKLYCANSLEIGDVINENVDTLSIDEVKDIFRDQVFYNYYASDDRPLTINVDRIELSYFIQSVKDQQGVFRAIPVWDFLASEEAFEGDSYTYSVLTINAIDGSIVDRNLGY